MSRIPKSKQPPAVEPAQNPHIITQERRYELITPLFGGGAETQQADPITVVRASEVRGQLRFWWRATRGGQFDGSLERMKAAEDALFGSMGGGGNGGGPSLVQVEVVEADKGRAFDKAQNQGRAIYDPASPYGYAAFPLQPSEERPAPGEVQVGVRFSLRLRYPGTWEHQRAIQSLFPASAQLADGPACEIAAALWAWETFGGIGARTRRGFGALRRKEQHPQQQPQRRFSRDAQHREIISLLASHVTAGLWPTDVPHLTPQVRMVLIDARDGMEAWRELLRKLKNFRQSRRDNQQRRPFGRSYWPEPEAVRGLTRQRLPKHQPMPGPDAFPRAAFGLPIVFQFKDRNTARPTDPRNDPRTTTLQGRAIGNKLYDRLASPLIVRPYVAESGAAFGLAVLLAGVRLPPQGLDLKAGNQSLNAQPVATTLSRTEADAIPSMQNRSIDVLQAFLDSLEG